MAQPIPANSPLSDKAMKRIGIYGWIVGLLMWTPSSWAFTKVGTTVATFLKLGTDARAMAMGNAYVAVSTGPESFYWNPAGSAWSPITAAKMGYTQWFAGIRLLDVSAMTPVNRYAVVGIGIMSVNSGLMEVTTLEHPDGTGRMFSYTGTAVALYASQRVYSRLSVGGAVKWIEEGIDHSTAAGFAMDFGLRFDAGWHGLVLAMGFSNFGERLRMNGENLKIQVDPNPEFGGNPEANARLVTSDWALPTQFRVGLAWYPLEGVPWLVAIDGVHPSDHEERIHVGMEYPLGPLALRWGYQFRSDVGGLTFGFGFQSQKPRYRIGLDYAYQDMGILGGVHRLTLSVIR